MSHEISETIRTAIQNSGKRLATIAKKTGVAMSALTEFMDGADMHLTSASRIAAYLGLELKPIATKKRGAIRPAKVAPSRKVSIVKKGRTMKPRAELIEDQATRAYFRRYGGAQQPNRKATKVFEQNGKHYIRLSSANGPLATYRITPGTGGGWKLSYVAEKHEGEIQ
jgi:hypothetical protein